MGKFVDQLKVNWAMGGARRFIVGLFGVVVACCLMSSCVAILGSGGSSSTPTVSARATDSPRPTEIAQATPIPATAVPTVNLQATVNSAVAATNAAKPTNTPVPTTIPTNAPLPTATVRVTVTTRPAAATDYTADEQRYIVETGRLAGESSEAIAEITRLSNDVSKNSKLLSDVNWKTDMALALVAAERAGNALVGLKPPPRFVATQLHLGRAGEQLILMKANMVLGLNNVDANRILLSTKNMTAVASEFTLALAELEKAKKP